MRRIQLGLALVLVAGSAAAETPDQLLLRTCGGCHAPDATGALSRIAHQRKTPEGWWMTIVRMQEFHQLTISSRELPMEQDAVQQLVKHLADTQGLAPEETGAFRYALEQRLDTVEPVDPDFKTMCGRCHSAARVMLQRRPLEEWQRLVHFHVGQFPSTEYSAGGRDRKWLELALDETSPQLARELPFESRAWDAWRAAKKPVLAGEWRLVGHQPGRGAFRGTLRATAEAPDRYALALDGAYADGTPLRGEGRALVYTGFEWRGSLTLAGPKGSPAVKVRQVLAASADGTRLVGRQFERDHPELGIDLTAHRIDTRTRLYAAIPDHVRRGSETRMRLVGQDLTGAVTLGAGLRVVKVISRARHEIELVVAALPDAEPQRVRAQVGDAKLGGAIAVYDEVARVAVEPAYQVARVGDGGGPLPKELAVFDAVAYAAGADGVAGTADDVRIGVVPARWSVAPWDERAARDRDVEFAGEMDATAGVFTPGVAGPNPQRAYGTNNAGNLKVTATVQDGEREVVGEGHLLVTVQRWINPPIP